MGRGHKVCPKCKTETGPRAFFCPKCNHDYKAQSCKGKSLSNTTLDADGDEVVNPFAAYENNPNVEFPSPMCQYVFIPGRMPQDKSKLYPFKPKSLAEDHMKEWVLAMKDFTFDSGSGALGKYTRSAVKYIVNEFFPAYPTGYIEPGKHKDHRIAIGFVEKYMKPYVNELIEGYK